MIDYKLFNKDCRDMSELADESVHVVCTSPPYWGLRKYSGVQDLIWGGDKDCQHEWGMVIEVGDNRYRGENAIVGSQHNADVWGGGKMLSQFCSLCGAWRGAFGLEPTPEMYIQHSVEILREVRRVLRKDGVVFWNIGDSYFGGGNNKGGKSLEGTKQGTNVGATNLQDISDIRGKHPILKPLDLCLIPERLSIALQEDGWWVRSIIIWHKANPMPESVNGWRWERHKVKIGNFKGKSDKYYGCKTVGREDEFMQATNAIWEDCLGCPKCSPNDGLVLRKGSWRPTDSYEQILMLTKSNSYYCDAEAVREAYSETVRWGGDKYKGAVKQGTHGEDAGLDRERSCFPSNGRNLRNVWSFPTVPYPGAHFAVFPEKLPELCIKAATPEVGVCAKCGAPWARVVEKKRAEPQRENWRYQEDANGRSDYSEAGGWYDAQSKTLGWRPTCSCNCPDKVPATVLDPFAGAGTTLLSAIKLGRNAVGYEISAEYRDMINKRINEVQIRYS